MKTALTIAVIVLLIIIGVYSYVRSSVSPQQERQTRSVQTAASGQVENDGFDIRDLIPGKSATPPQATSSVRQTTRQIPEPDHTIYHTVNGFSPQTIKIERGDTVEWQNETTTGMWVASDEHPVHAEYNGTSLKEHCTNESSTRHVFDQCEIGSSFTFTFNKKGEWRYHNHVNPNATGVIIVKKEN